MNNYNNFQTGGLKMVCNSYSNNAVTPSKKPKLPWIGLLGTR